MQKLKVNEGQAYEVQYVSNEMIVDKSAFENEEMKSNESKSAL